MEFPLTPPLRLSIVTLTYQDPEGFRSTLKSLEPWSQLSQNWEHVVVDSSPELNSSIYKEYGSWPFKRVPMDPRGIYPGFNLGLRHAKGELVWFLNGGDQLVEAHNLEKILDAFRDNSEVDIVGAGANVFRGGELTYSVFPKQDFRSNLQGLNRLCHQALIYRRRFFDRVGPYSEDFKIAGDYEHHLRSALAGVQFLNVGLLLAQFDRGGISDDTKNAFAEFDRAWSLHKRKFSLKDQIKYRIWRDLRYGEHRLLDVLRTSPLERPLKKLWYSARKLTSKI